MNSLPSRSGPSSRVGSMSDLDGLTFQNDLNFQNSYFLGGETDYGFDPPAQHRYQPFQKLEHDDTPPAAADTVSLHSWAGFDQNKDLYAKQSHSSMSPENIAPSFERDNMIQQNLPNKFAAVLRHGQVTPPRSNSASSEMENKAGQEPSSKPAAPEKRKRASKVLKDIDSVPATTNTTTRKRKSTRKESFCSVGIEDGDDNNKRKQSLEKNRLAAAKCRVNKKEKTEQLQRDSHDKAVQNAVLKDQIMRMKEEVQQMNAILLAHANCQGCKSPDEIQKHLSNLGNEFFNQHMSSISNHQYSTDYPDMSMEMSHLDESQMMHDDYFANHNGSGAMLNPPLPDFDRSGDFDVHTPMHTD